MFSCKKALGFDQSLAQPVSFSSAHGRFCSFSDFCADSHGEIDLDNEVLETTKGSAVYRSILLTPEKWAG